jgi:HK97 family phage portal protein
MGFFSALTRRIASSIEKRSYSGSIFADMEHGLTNPAFAGTTAGMPVTDTTSISIIGVFAAVRNIADDIAKTQRGVFKSVPGGFEQIYDHPMHRILCQSPNPESGCMDFLRALMGCTLLYGNGYARIIRDRYTNAPVHAYPIHPWRVRKLRDAQGWEYYSIDGMDGSPPGAYNGRVESDDMIHIKNFGLNGSMGLATTRVAKESLGLTLALEQYGASFFGNSALPKGFFYTDGQLTPEAASRLKEKWEAIHRGASNSHKTAVMENGVKWQSMSVTPEEGQFLLSRQFQLIEIARLFRIPPHKLMDLTKGTFANTEQLAGEYIQDCLLTWTTLISEEFKRKLCRPDEVNVHPRFLFTSFFRGDMAARTAYYTALVSWGIASRNDCREMEGLNRVPGLDTYLVPQNFSAASALETMTKSQLTLLAVHAKMNGVELDANGLPVVTTKNDGSLAMSDQVDPSEQATPELMAPAPAGIALPGQQIIDSALYYRAVAQAQQPVLADALRRVLKTEADKVIRAAKKDQGAVEEFYTKHPEHVRAALAPVLSAVAASVWALSAEKPTDEQRAGVEAFISRSVAKSIADSREDLATEIELSGIEIRTSKWTVDRPEKVAEKLIGDLLVVLKGETK